MAKILIKVALHQDPILIKVGVDHIQILIKVAQHQHQVLIRVGLIDTMSLFQPPNVVRLSDTIALYRTTVFHLTLLCCDDIDEVSCPNPSKMIRI